MSTYLDYLPAALQQGPLMGRFLLAFQAILTGGVPAPVPSPLPSMPEGLEQLLDRLHTFFDPSPGMAPDDFLPWLAGWVATSLRDDWSPEIKRKFVGQIVPLYKQRGTRIGIQKVLELWTDAVDVVEVEGGSTPAHYFRVVLTLKEKNPTLLARMARQVIAVIDREKPAHTFYGLELLVPGLQIDNKALKAPPGQAQIPGVFVGVNTLLGTVPAPSQP